MDAYDAVRVLLPLNITVFALDLSGSGLSEGEYITLGVRESEDLRAVIAHLRAGGRVTKIGLWGRSMGAATSLFYGQKDPSVAALVLDSPFSRLTDLMQELVDTFSAERNMHVPRPLVRGAVALLRFSIKRKAKFDIADLDVVEAASHSFVPALFGHATGAAARALTWQLRATCAAPLTVLCTRRAGDHFILPRHTEALYAAYPGDKNFIRFEGGHNTQRPPFFYDSVSIFFLNTLHPPETPAVPPPPARPSSSAAGTAASLHAANVAAAHAAEAAGVRPPPPAAFVPDEMPPPPLVPCGAAPGPELEMLLQMGFPRAVAEAALRRFRSVDVASTWLVDVGEEGWAALLREGPLGGAPPPHVQVLAADGADGAAAGGAGGAGSAGTIESIGGGASGATAPRPAYAGAGGGPAFGDADPEEEGETDRALAEQLARSLAAAAARGPPAAQAP